MIYIGLPQWPHPKWVSLGITSRDAGNLKIDKYRPGAPFLMAGDSIQHTLFAIFGDF
ncbi:hypothetical protein [Klebsiella variicola]|uniref:hypothetical protein n=1 Tax=Klebsiella variicola TaxID=244366 RepID=UPI0018AC7E89|nr:hypothetical protein [Klebsiella variicola]